MMIVSVLQKCLLRLMIFQYHRIQPIVRVAIVWLSKELDTFNLLKELSIGCSHCPLVGNVFIQMLQLCTTKSCIDIWHSIVIAYHIVAELPPMGYLGLSREMFSQCAQILVCE